MTKYLLEVFILKPMYQHIKIKPYLFDINSNIPIPYTTSPLYININSYKNIHKFSFL